MKKLEDLSLHEIKQYLSPSLIREHFFSDLAHTDPEIIIYDEMGEHPKKIVLNKEWDITIIGFTLKCSILPYRDYELLEVLIAVGNFHITTSGNFKVDIALGRMHYNWKMQMISMDLYYNPVNMTS